MTLKKTLETVPFAFLVLISISPNLQLQAQIEAPEKVVSIKAVSPQESVSPGETFELEIVLTIKDGWHVNANKPLDEFLIPTEIVFAESEYFEIAGIEYPEAKIEKFSFSETGMAVYSHAATIKTRLKITQAANTDPLTVRGQLNFQTCNDAVCLPPAQKAFEASIPVNIEMEPSDFNPDSQSESLLAAQNEKAAFSGIVEGQSENIPNEEALVQAELKFSLDKVLAGGTLKAAIILHIKEGWHINSNKPRDEFLIPTEIELSVQNGVSAGELIFPPDKLFQFSFSEEKVAVYDGETAIGLPISVAENFPEDVVRLSGKVIYQACDDVSCLAPTSVDFSGEIPIAQRNEAIALVNAALFENIAFDESNGAPDNEISGLIAGKGLALTFMLIFLGGLALNLTPCVYPLIPITISYFGGQARGSTAKVFTLAVFYLLGMAITYSIMGIVAALSGSLFGSILQNPLVLIFIAAIMVALALSMFGVWELTIPQSLNQLAGGSRKGYAGSLFMGLTVGIVAAPCIGPFVLGLLTYVGTKGDPVLGFWMFFTLSIGLGLPFLVLGTFSGSMKNLPRSGLWMVWIKKIFGFVLLGLAVYFVTPILPQFFATYLLPLVLLAGGLFIGFFDQTQMAAKAFPVIKKASGIFFIAIAAWLAWPEDTAHAESWNVYSREALEQAQTDGIPVIIDFTADWCISCKELEKLTFPSKPVVERADQFLLLRADLTKFASPPVEEIKKEFNIKGLPTVVFINQDGMENKNLRVIGFVNGEDFSRRMDAVLEKMSN
jgi:thiol:disulfide interchange protein DsbD